MMLTLICVVWYMVGIAGVIYWFTKDFDLKYEDIISVVVLGLYGPISFIIGYFVHGDSIIPSKTIILNKRIPKKK